MELTEKAKSAKEKAASRLAEAKTKVEAAKAQNQAANAEREKAKKFNEAKNAHIDEIEVVKDAEAQDLAHYIPIAEHYAQSNVAEATAAGLLARILRLEVLLGIREEPPKPE